MSEEHSEAERNDGMSSSHGTTPGAAAAHARSGKTKPAAIEALGGYGTWTFEYIEGQLTALPVASGLGGRSSGVEGFITSASWSRALSELQRGGRATPAGLGMTGGTGGEARSTTLSAAQASSWAWSGKLSAGWGIAGGSMTVSKCLGAAKTSEGGDGAA